MSEAKGGKWAAEVYDFLQLFRKVNNSFSGLLLIEIGWLLFLWLLSQLTPAGDPPALPEIKLFIWGTFFVRDLFLPGALFLAFIWAIFSRIWLYIWLPLDGIIRGVVIVLIALTSLFLIVVNIPLAIILLPFHTWYANWRLKKISEEYYAKKATAIRNVIRVEQQFWRTLDSNDAQVLCKIITSKKDFDRISNVKDGSPEYQKALDGFVKESIYSDIIDESFSLLFMMDFAKSHLLPIIRDLFSRLTIGIAPLDSVNYYEELNSS